MSGADEGLKAVTRGLSKAGEKLLGPTEALFNSIVISLLAVSAYVLTAIWDIGYTPEDLEHLKTVWEVIAVKSAVGGSFVFLVCIVYYKFQSGNLSLEEE
tara:strand:- start:118 stop:417 length:300 start_codon:yes stop_codon:yes gene_type:complete